MFGRVVTFSVKKESLVTALEAITEYGTVKIDSANEGALYKVSIRCPMDTCTSYVNNILALIRDGVQIWNLQIK